MLQFNPPVELIILIFIKSAGWLTLIAILTVLRISVAKGPSQGAAALALLMALLGLAAHHLPALLGVYTGPWVLWAADYKTAIAGYAPMIAASLPFAISGILPGRRFWALDAIHAVAVIALALFLVML